MKRKTTTVTALFRQMFNGMPLSELYEIEQAVSDSIDWKEEKDGTKKQTARLIELTD